MCGEKPKPPTDDWQLTGSPPHVRGKGKNGAETYQKIRITPACAGKSLLLFIQCVQAWDHPRMCGEKGSCTIDSGSITGSPPHVRGKVVASEKVVHRHGITPACAGKRLKRSRSTVTHAAIVPLFPSVCNKPAGSDGSPAGHDAPPFLPIENAAPASPAYNLRSL